jgi:hypothetical protein
MKVVKIECTPSDDGLVSVQITGENGDFLTATVPLEKFMQGIVDLADEADLTKGAICLLQ